MSNKFPKRGDFDIPSSIIDEHEWIADELIDGDVGVVCTLVFPPKWSECPNCYIDVNTGRSSNIYKTGGPIPFEQHQTCPYCEGRGREELQQTQDIRLRVYWSSRSWVDIGVPIANPDGVAMTIGYMTDLPALERADYIILHSDLEKIRQYKVYREGEAIPHGFNKNRYFIQYVRRGGGG